MWLEDGPYTTGCGAVGGVEDGGHLGGMVGVVVVENHATDRALVVPTTADPVERRHTGVRRPGEVGPRATKRAMRARRIASDMTSRLCELDTGRAHRPGELE